MALPSIDDVMGAAERIKGFAVETPLITAPVLDERVGGTILLKAENFQRVGAFKFRGAYNAVSQIDRKRYPGGVVAASSGNHAQGIACSAALCSMPCLIVMPSDAPALKIERTTAYGAEIIPYNRDTEDRIAIAHDLAARRGAAFVHPFDNPHVIAGQGTTGLELMRQAAHIGNQPDAVLVGCSGGGLASGVSLAVRAQNPATQVYTVEPSGFDDFAKSLTSGHRETNTATSGSICDALLSPTPGELTFAICQKTLAGGLVVTDDEVKEAMRFAFHDLKMVIEPGGAVTLAAVLSGKIPVENRTIACIISGGNVDPETYAQIITG